MSADKSKAEVWADMIEVSAPGAAAELRRLDAVNRELLEALKEARKFAHHHMLIEGAAYGANYSSTRSERAKAAKAFIDAAIAKATDV